MGEKEIRTYLNEAREKKTSEQALVQRSIEMARELGAAALNRLKTEERTFLAAMSRLVVDEASRRFVRDFCDDVLADEANGAENLRRLLSAHGGVPTFFSSMGRLRMKAAAMASRSMQQAAVAEVQRVFRSTFGEHVLPPAKAGRRADALAKEGVQLMLQPLYPHVFGRNAAQEYAETLEHLLARQPRCGVVVQPWRLCPGMSPCSPEMGARSFADHLQRLVSAAGSRLLVVETRCSDTLPIIVEGMKQVLDRPENDGADVALVLPGYLRSSIPTLRELVDWARPRAERGAAPLKVLLVKGDHLEAEQQVAARYGTEAQLCASKAEADVSFVRLVNAAMNYPAKVLTPMVGTHELTHLCYAALRWAASGREGLPPICLLLGLGNHLVRQFARLGSPAVLCAPLLPEQAESTVAERYLLQMLRELARPEGYLSAGYAADATSNTLSTKARALMAANNMSAEPSRADAPAGAGYVPGHVGSLLERAYVDSFYAAAKAEVEREQPTLPLLVGGQEHPTPLTFVHRSLTVPGLADYRFACADYAAVEMTLKQAQTMSAAPLPPADDRMAALLKAARDLRRRSTEFAALLVRDTGHTLSDAQEELRDAIDALRYYADDARRSGFRDGTVAQPLGVVVVATGVAHPLAEAAAGIAAAWVAGNAIIYKPAAYSTLLGSRLAELLAAAGVRLICLPGVDNEISARLMMDARVAALVGTGGPDLLKRVATHAPACAALLSSCAAPSIYLSRHGDWEAALEEILRAVYRRSGQSATCPHTLMVDAEVYDNPAFMAALKDAVGSLCAKPTWLEGADVGPVSMPLSEAQRNLLEGAAAAAESWLVLPQPSEKGSLLWQPGVSLEATPDTELAAHGGQLPLLGLVRVASAEAALELQRRQAAGGCAILYSHDAEEIAAWKRESGCRWLAINCCPTPRPGMVPGHTLRSTLQGAVAPMAGGPNYAAALSRWQESGRPSMRSTRRHLVFDPKGIFPVSSGAEETMRLSAAADSISYWWEQEFGEPQPLPALPGQQSLLSYRPLQICLRIEKAMADADIAIALMAAMQAGCRVQLSCAALRPWVNMFAEKYGVPQNIESRSEYEAVFPSLAAAGVIVRDPAAMDDTLACAAACGLALIDAPVVSNGRVELLRCMEEQLVIESK